MALRWGAVGATTIGREWTIAAIRDARATSSAFSAAPARTGSSHREFFCKDGRLNRTVVNGNRSNRRCRELRTPRKFVALASRRQVVNVKS